MIILASLCGLGLILLVAVLYAIISGSSGADAHIRMTRDE
jgi:hypothetical protein